MIYPSRSIKLNYVSSFHLQKKKHLNENNIMTSDTKTVLKLANGIKFNSKNRKLNLQLINVPPNKIIQDKTTISKISKSLNIFIAKLHQT